MNETTFSQLNPGIISVFRNHYIDEIKKVLAEDFDLHAIDIEGNNALHLVSMPMGIQTAPAMEGCGHRSSPGRKMG